MYLAHTSTIFNIGVQQYYTIHYHTVTYRTCSSSISACASSMDVVTTPTNRFTKMNCISRRTARRNNTGEGERHAIDLLTVANDDGGTFPHILLLPLPTVAMMTKDMKNKGAKMPHGCAAVSVLSATPPAPVKHMCSRSGRPA